MSLRLQLSFQGYWQVASGDGAGAFLDALAIKDAQGLPFVPGRQLKGLLRDAARVVRQAGVWQDLEQSLPGEANLEHCLFGSASQSEQEDRYHTEPGMLQIDSAVLSAQEQQALRAHPYLIPELFEVLHSTAIDSTTGTARDKSLRGYEVALPMTLEARVDWTVTALSGDMQARQQALIAQKSLAELLEPLLPLVDAIGSQRTRGLGEVVLSLQPEHATSAQESR